MDTRFSATLKYSPTGGSMIRGSFHWFPANNIKRTNRAVKNNVLQGNYYFDGLYINVFRDFKYKAPYWVPVPSVPLPLGLIWPILMTIARQAPTSDIYQWDRKTF